MNRSEIADRALEEFPGCKKVAVQNFLWTLVGTDKSAEEGNLLSDAASYRWNTQTIGAIQYGICLYYNSLN